MCWLLVGWAPRVERSGRRTAGKCADFRTRFGATSGRSSTRISGLIARDLSCVTPDVPSCGRTGPVGRNRCGGSDGGGHEDALGVIDVLAERRAVGEAGAFVQRAGSEEVVRGTGLEPEAGEPGIAGFSHEVVEDGATESATG